MGVKKKKKTTQPQLRVVPTDFCGVLVSSQLLTSGVWSGRTLLTDRTPPLCLDYSWARLFHSKWRRWGLHVLWEYFTSIFSVQLTARQSWAEVVLGVSKHMKGTSTDLSVCVLDQAILLLSIVFKNIFNIFSFNNEWTRRHVPPSVADQPANMRCWAPSCGLKLHYRLWLNWGSYQV